MNDSSLHDGLIQTLEQGVSLLEALTDEQYCEPVPQAFSSGIGGHYRHSLEHFLPLLDQPDADLVDYDARERDTEIETVREHALAVTRQCLTKARSISAENLNRDVQVRCSVCANAESPVSGSTYGREIMYAIIHAVHHYALIKVMCNLLEVAQPAGFGMAPSTIRHQNSTS